MLPTTPSNPWNPNKSTINQEILTQVILQVNKEFTVNFSTEITATQLEIEIKWLVDELLNKYPTRFFQTLYRIDIPEQKAKNALKSPKPIEELSMLILNRVFQKVLIKKAWKEKGL